MFFFQEYDFHVRWPTVRLLTILLSNRGKELQEVILVSPMAVSKLMDLLADSREIIRNDVSSFISSHQINDKTAVYIGSGIDFLSLVKN